MAGAWRLDSLPFDVLILIFNYCHAFDLVRLSEVCARFYNIIHKRTLWVKRSNQPLATNQTSARFRERCNPLLCLHIRWRVSHNWQYGRYEKRFLLSQKAKLMPWLQLTRNTLWWGGGNRLCGFKRSSNDFSDSFKETVLVFDEDNIGSDICKFVVKDEYIVSGHRDGSLKFWTKTKRFGNHFYCSIDRAHASDVNAVDKTGQIIVSGAGDGTVKVWRSPNRIYTEAPLASKNVRDRVWSVVADPTGLKFAVGTSGNGDGPPLCIFDTKCCNISDTMKHNWKQGAGILDMVWENPNTLITCGYDTYIRKWDIRCGMCVSSWPDPTNATLYCISSDYQHTLVTGTQFNSKAVLWDQRQKNYVQFFFLNQSRLSSPIYSISFDCNHLYGAVDQHLVALKFSGYSYTEINYKGILTYE